MPTFDTPEPIFATIELAAGTVRIDASDRADTVVEVRPSDVHDDADVQTAEQTQVEYANGRLLVKAPKLKARWWLFTWGGSIEVTVDLPTGSRVDASAGLAEIHGEGRLGESKFTTASGDVRLDQTGKLRVSTGDGDISVARSVGHTEVTTANGKIWIREIGSTAVVKTVNGAITLGEVTGDLRLNTANGDISVDRALASVGAKTASGSVRIGEVVRGSVDLESGDGELEVGVRHGTAAWLDVSTLSGMVRNSLEPSDGPAPSDETVEVRARTSSGDIMIRRS
jgi:DUF4097 and DUF4098 domain-containing protein YvlB